MEPVTDPLARHTATLLADAGLHGHEYAIDATLAAPNPTTVLNSDPERDLTEAARRPLRKPEGGSVPPPPATVCRRQEDAFSHLHLHPTEAAS